jgi:predicted MFS family arabinose efflux permease
MMGLYRVVALVLGWQLAASVCYYAVFAATPFFRDEFALTGAQVGLVVTALTLGYAVFLLPLGAVTDRFGEHRTLTLGLCGLAAGAVLVTRAPSYPLLLGSVFVLGSLYGTAMPGTNKAIFENTPPARQNLAIGIKQVGVTAGSGASALLVTGIAGVLAWEAGFYAVAAVGLVVACLFWLLYRGGGAGGAADYPDFGALLSNRPYRSLTVAGVCLGAGLFTTTGYTILYIDESVGASIAFGGAGLAALPVSGSAGRLVTGWLSDVLPGEPRQAIGVVLLVQALAAALLFCLLAVVGGRLTVAAAFIALGFFILGCTGVYYSCMATFVSADAIGGATAGGQLALTAGALVAPPVFGYLSETAGYRAGWFMLAGLAAVAAVSVVRVILTDPPAGVTPAVTSAED